MHFYSALIRLAAIPMKM